ncbi:MAG: sugar transferase [Clostridium sp.]|uniref:sugar transferase n=1 Tax=Clostridium sp. TaxID=1506 RepID=UPI003F2CB3AB
MEEFNIEIENEVVNTKREKKIDFINITIYDRIKRILDLIFCLILLVVALPILGGACILVYLQDFKNPIYVQKRVGLNNQEFKMYKVRSMVIDAEKNGAQWAKANDTRVTWVGKIIRKTRIDELPQLVNVIKGEMSLIGPRPEREVFYQEFEKTIPQFRDRLKIKPGITGYAQVNGGYDVTPKEKLDMDLYYVENRSVKTDVAIVAKTIYTVISGDGAR